LFEYVPLRGKKKYINSLYKKEFLLTNQERRWSIPPVVLTIDFEHTLG